ncbi:histidine kinase [Oxalobacteraceae bacterium R-40]|uniref:Oxygen sensor histidine kinase NreB n=1 Tax=Keguizhuia sedimenti TaxID=3064264 RepID=A0ABU1BPV7_9BURK|nr:histidine kinase [Oxalobacteraceae bacterium R-40]
MIEFENLVRLAPSETTTPGDDASSLERITEDADELPALHALGNALTVPFEKIMRLAARLLDAPATLIFLEHADTVWYQSRFENGSGSEFGRNAELEGSALIPAQSFGTKNRKPDIRNFDEPIHLGDLQVRFYACVPIVNGSGRRFGSLCVLGSEHRELGEFEIATLTDLASIAVDEIELRVSGMPKPEIVPGTKREISPARNLALKKDFSHALRESEERYQSLLGLLSDWHWEYDENGCFTLIAKAGQTRSNAQFAQYIGKTFCEMPVKHMSEQDRKTFEQAILRHQPFQEVVFLWQDANEPAHYLSVSGQPIFGTDGTFKGYRGVSKDVTEKIRIHEELARANAALRDLSNAQQAFREAERKRIARELHDELAQLLASSRMELSLLQNDLKPAPSSHKRLDSVDRMIGSSIVSLRKLATDLRPSSLDEGGLYYALRTLLKTFSENAGIECHLVANEADLGMDETRSTAIFRLVEECLSNIEQHANARKAVIQIRRSGNSMELRVQDDGRGIRQDEIDKANGFGLMEMRERVRKMSGRINIKGLPGKGTRVAVSLPQFFTT